MLPDKDKTKEQLISELDELRQWVSELETVNTERKQAERQKELSLKILELLNRSRKQPEMIREILLLVKEFSGCDAVGIRLREGEDFPYYETNGFIEGHVSLENRLCVVDQKGELIRDSQGSPVLECMCGNIICGRFDPEKPFFTQGGSFWTNSTTELLATTTEEDRQARTRNRCNGEGYESVALIPLKTEEGNIGLLQLNQFQRNHFTPELISFYEGIANSIGIVLARKQAEEALLSSEENFHHSLDNSPLGIRIFGAVTEGQQTLYANRAVLDIYGFTSLEEFNTIPRIQSLTPESYAEYLVRREKRLRGEAITAQYDLNIVRPDGEVRHLQVFPKNVLWNGERRYQSIYLDITERKQAEQREEELQQELSLSMRLASVGELVASVAHEINNPLTGVLGFSERLLRKSTDEGTRRDLARIHSEAQRMVKVMDNLRSFTRRREPEKQYSDINDILQKTLELRAYELKTGNIEIVTDLASGLPEVEVDSHQIQEVFLNIILNAEQGMTEANGGGKLTIKTGKIKNHVRISFADDGPGISTDHFGKLFDPFFTTRGEQGGTGLGLSICHGIVTEHGGRLYVRSKAGEGATFFVELPCS